MENRYSAIGKRKNAIASVILQPGKGERTVNGRQIGEFLRSDVLKMIRLRPRKLG